MGIDDIVLSNIIRYVKDYLVTNDERTLFDWLVFAQRGFGLTKPFRHSISQVNATTNVSRYLQDKYFNHFVELGFLRMGKDTFNNNEFRCFFVDFSVLANKEVLGRIVREGTDTHNEMLKMFSKWANEQANGEKTKSKREQKILSAKLDAVEPLLDTLNKCYADRVKMYNNGELTYEMPKRTKSYATLVCTPRCKKLFVALMEKYNNDSIKSAFTAYADDILRGNTKTDKILPYFLTYEDGAFVVVDRFMEKYTLNYGHENTQ